MTTALPISKELDLQSTLEKQIRTIKRKIIVKLHVLVNDDDVSKNYI